MQILKRAGILRVLGCAKFQIAASLLSKRLRTNRIECLSALETRINGRSRRPRAAITLAKIILPFTIFATSQPLNAQTIQTYAGGGICGDTFGASQGMQPYATAVDSAGNVYVADFDLMAVCRIDAVSGKITTAAGTGHPGYSGDGGAATSAELFNPNGLAIDAAGDIYILDSGNNAVREISAASGVISTIAGTGTGGYSGDGGAATSANIDFPQGIMLDSAGNLYISDTGNYRVRVISAATGIITTIAGNGSPKPPNKGQSFGDGGAATAAYINGPTGLTMDSAGNLYVAEQNRGSVREVIAATGIISTFVGTGRNGYSGDGGLATSAQLSVPQGLAFDASGDLYIADEGNSVIREVYAANGTIATVVGNGTSGYSGDGGPASSAMLNVPFGIAFDAAGDLYIADFGNLRLRKVSVTTGAIATAAGNGLLGYGGDGGPLLQAEISVINNLAFDNASNLYFADGINRVREIHAATGIISTVVGNGATGDSGDGGPATAAELNAPAAVAVDATGNIYIADYANSRIREVSASSGLISTIAGTGTSGYSGDGGPATAAQLFFPSSVAVDSAGDVYIADEANGRVREVNASTGIITTVATNTGPGSGLPSQQVAVDSLGNLYFAAASAIKELSAQTGTITTIAGNGTYGYSGDGGLATAANVGNPFGLTFDRAGNLFFSDFNFTVIREVNAASGIITTVAGNGTFGFSGDGGSPINAQLSGPSGIIADANGNLFIEDTGNHVIRTVTGITSQSSPPSITYSVSGAMGNNGWYIGNVQVAWSANGNGTTITSETGCGTIVISTDTAGQVVSCTATNAGGTTTQSVRIKRDATPPLVTISTPPNGASYPQGSITNASYNCSDAVSGLASCGGTVANGAPINTSAMGGMSFAVTATDQAGNSTTVSSSYTVTAPIVGFTLSPSSLPFGNQAINVASSAAPVTLTNTGTTALPISAVSLNGSNPGQFSDTSNCGTSVARGASCSITVVFLPTSVGNKSASLTVTAASGGGTRVAALSGTGVDATFTLTPATIAFGNQEITVASSAQTVTLTNTASVSLPITTIALTGSSAAQFSESSNCGASVPAGGSCAINVTFTPSSVGSKSATLKVTAGGGAVGQSSTLSGTGTDPTYTLAPNSIAFGNQQTNTSSGVQIVTLANSSAIALPVTSISITGTNAGQFSQNNTCGSSVPAGSGCTISVTFLPTSTGVKSANLNTNLGGGAGARSISLSGTGIVPTYTLTPSALSFGNQTHGSGSAPQSITLTNSGTLAVSVTSVSLTGSNPGQFSQSNNCGSSVAVGASCTIQVVFRPTTTGSKSANLKVTGGAGASSETVTLTGTGS